MGEVKCKQMYVRRRLNTHACQYQLEDEMTRRIQPELGIMSDMTLSKK